jgi:hypothetical protein
MGYDMHFVTKPPEEAEMVAKLSAEFHKAAEERDALPEGDAGHPTTEMMLHDEIAPDATPEYRAAQTRVHNAYILMRAAEKSYFQLNIWGMSRFAKAMYALGMAYDSSGPRSAWPEIPGGWESPVGHTHEALQDDSLYVKGDDGEQTLRERAPEESDLEWARCYVEHYYPGDPRLIEQEHVDEAKAYEAKRREHLSVHPGDAEGIPLHKLGSNDGWIVTPVESLQALSAWHAAPHEHRQSVLREVGVTGDNQDESYWQSWLEFLETSTKFDGFEVH